jgi:hypothetical protein
MACFYSWHETTEDTENAEEGYRIGSEFLSGLRGAILHSPVVGRPSCRAKTARQSRCERPWHETTEDTENTEGGYRIGSEILSGLRGAILRSPVVVCRIPSILRLWRDKLDLAFHTWDYSHKVLDNRLVSATMTRKILE